MSDAPVTDFSWQSSSRTDVGMVRQLNEDACLDRPEAGLWAVADGMGGHTAGDTASRMIVDALAALDPLVGLSTFIDEIEERLIDVNANLRALAATKEGQTTIGSTVAALVASGRVGICAWAGDSRVYRCREGTIEQITQDHALVEELVERGVLSRDQAVGHPQGNLVTRAVGAADQLCLDIEIVELCDGDTFILCSDGLDKELSPEEIAEVVARENDQAVSEVLVNIALSRGCRDNITVIAVDIHRQISPSEGEDTAPRIGEADRSAGS